MIPLNPSQIVKGIGSLLPGNYDPQKVVNEAIMRLAKSTPALEFVNSTGWKVVQAEYNTLINELRQRVLSLAGNGVKHAAEIQRTAAVIQAAELLIGVTDRVIRAHQDALKTIDEHKGTPSG